MTSQHFTLFDTSIGRCGIAWGPRGINAVQLPMGDEARTRARIRQRHGDIAESPPPADVQNAIDGIVELLAGKPNDLLDITLDLDGVPEFNRGVYDIARRIPPGQTLTYGDIAKRLGGVELSRDVGQVCSGVIPVRSWCRATACSPPAASPADFPPMAASSPSSKCSRSRAQWSITRRACFD